MSTHEQVAHRHAQPHERVLRIGRVALTTISVPAKFSIPPHGHALPGVCVVTAGEFDERTPRGSRACTPGTVRYSPADDFHRLRMRDVTMECAVITLNRDDLPASTSRVYVESPPLAALAAQLREDADYDAGCPMIAESVALELFAGVVRHDRVRRYRHAPRWLLDVRRTLDEPQAWSLTLDDLGSLCGHNGAHLAFAFREHFGLTVGAHVRLRQLSMARRSLLGSTMSIARVAALSGFADQSHLTRQMQRTLGVTPAQLRQRFSAPLR